MTDQEKARLHDLLEQLGINIDILKDLESTLQNIEQRYAMVGFKMLFGGAVIAVAVAVSIALGGIALNVVSDAQKTSFDAATRADAATVRLATVTEENRGLIRRLESVAAGAQERGRKTDLLQCRELNELRSIIRTVLRMRGRSQDLVNRFKSKDCSMLPNRDPVTP